MPSPPLLKTAKRLARGALEQVPLGIWQRLFPKDVIALGYHIVSDEDLPHLKYYRYKDSRQFEADVAFVAGRFRSVSYDEIVARRLRGIAMPPQSFLFTFDDGFAECYDVIRPILQRHATSGVFFITTDFIDDRALFFETKVSLCLSAVERLGDREAHERAASLELNAIPPDPGRRTLAETRLSFARIAPPVSPAHRTLALWLLGFEQDDEEEIAAACAALGVDPEAYSRRRPLYLSAERVRQLAADGFTIGGHGIAHLPLQRMGSDQLEREVVTSCRIVRELTGQASVPFAFPYHGKGIDRDMLAGLRERHPFIELIFDTGDLRRDAPFIVDRVWADPPPADGTRRTNLPESLRRSWSYRQAWFRAGAGQIPSPSGVVSS
jgi:peptidoglycan/xylan/chitin deacetylase (PgdA/CDA1 family)